MSELQFNTDLYSMEACLKLLITLAKQCLPMFYSVFSCFINCQSKIFKWPHNKTIFLKELFVYLTYSLSCADIGGRTYKNLCFSSFVSLQDD